jgi:hypothetical protein
MKSKIVFACVLIGMALTITALWFRVRALEASVDQLTQKLLSVTTVRTVVIPLPEREKPTDPKRNPFKVIDVSNVGVPWSVDRAMIGDGDSHRATTNR